MQRSDDRVRANKLCSPERGRERERERERKREQSTMHRNAITVISLRLLSPFCFYARGGYRSLCFIFSFSPHTRTRIVYYYFVIPF